MTFMISDIDFERVERFRQCERIDHAVREELEAMLAERAQPSRTERPAEISAPSPRWVSWWHIGRLAARVTRS